LLQKYVNAKYESVPQQVNVRSKKKGKLTLQCDEAWSFVGNKDNKQWIWLALDVITREIVGVYIGERERGLLGFGILCLQSIVNVLSVIQILVSLQQYFPQSRHSSRQRNW